jgi:hypothetical protein
MAMDQIRHMSKMMLIPFMNPVPQDTLDTLSRIAGNIRLIDERMRAALAHSLQDMAWTVSSTEVTKYMSATLIEPSLMTYFPGTDCPVCSPSDLDVNLEALREHDEFRIRQERLERHGELARAAFHHADSVRLKKEVARYVDVTKMVQLRARDCFATTKRGFSSFTVEDIGLYHPQNFGLQLLGESQEVKDCLGRSPLHYLLDHALGSRAKTTHYSVHSLNSDIENQKRFINDQDVLGQSPLHIASQGGSIFGRATTSDARSRSSTNYEL